MKRVCKLFAVVLCLCLLLTLVSGCRKQENTPEDATISVFASFYPLYAAAHLVTENVPGVNLNCLVQPQDGCLRDYQLSDWDYALLQTSDLVIAGGRGLESFESLLYSMGESGPAVAFVLYNMELSEQRAVNTQTDSQSHWLDHNPHIYMQVDAMKEISQRIADSMILLDPDNEALYQANLKEANEKLEGLANEIQAVCSGLAGKKVIVMNEALVYAGKEYGLDVGLYYERESGEDLQDADLGTCLDTLGKSEAEVILIEKQAPQRLCEALQEAGYQIVRMDVLSTRRAAEGSAAYFEALRSNAQAVAVAFAEADTTSEADQAGGNE